MRRFILALFLALALTGRASAQLLLLDQFNPGLGGLVAAAFDDSTSLVWTYPSFGTEISSYTRAGAFVASIPRPGESSNDIDLDIPSFGFTLNGTPLPAGTLLVINGENGPADVYALDKSDGSVLATLNTAFGASHVVGGAWNPQTNTLFLVTDQNDATPNLIAEIDPATGAVLNSFSPGVDFIVNFGDLAISTAGALYLISDSETFIRVLAPSGELLQDLPLPAGVSGQSGVAVDNTRDEGWISGTGGALYRLGVDGTTTTTSTTLVSTTTSTTLVSTTTSVTVTTVVSTTVASTSTTSTTIAGGPCELLTGKKLLLKAKDGSAKKGIGLLAADTALTLGGGNESADDPVLHGGTLRVVSAAGDGFDDTYALAADRWSYKKKVGQNLGYKFRPTSPIKSVLIQPGKRIKMVANGTGLGHTLGTDPQPVDVVLTIGGHCYCWRFGGDVAFKAGKKWLAKEAPVPAVCGAPAP